MRFAAGESLPSGRAWMRVTSNSSSGAPEGDRAAPSWQPAQYVATISAAARPLAAAGDGAVTGAGRCTDDCPARTADTLTAKTPTRTTAAESLRIGPSFC